MAFYGEQKGWIIFRKHAMQYLKLQKMPRHIRIRLILAENGAEFMERLDEIWTGLG